MLPCLDGQRSNGCAPHRSWGFTLIEVLVAIAILAILALMSWRGIDAMVKVQEVTKQRNKEISSLQTGLSQWIIDLNHVKETGMTSQMYFDGNVFLVVREDTADPQKRLRAVVWAVRERPDGQRWWARWQSSLFFTRGELFNTIKQARAWFAQQGSKDEAATRAWGQAVDVIPIESVDIQAYDENSNEWVSLKNANVLPPGIRLEITLAESWAISGVVQRDWISPTYIRRRQSGG